MNKLYLRATGQLLRLPLIVGVLVFLPAGTVRYWQAWLFTVVFLICSIALTLYLAVADPALLERRMNVGPNAETEPAQKIIMAIAMLSFAGMALLSALDHRFGWSHVPTLLVVLGNLLIIIANFGFLFVFRANTYGAASIQVVDGQTVISDGPYAIVRHPMYAWGLLLLVGMPLALGSLWGLLLLGPATAGLVWRLLDEERFLARNLDGYTDYMIRVPSRLIPRIW